MHHNGWSKFNKSKWAKHYKNRPLQALSLALAYERKSSIRSPLYLAQSSKYFENQTFYIGSKNTFSETRVVIEALPPTPQKGREDCWIREKRKLKKGKGLLGDRLLGKSWTFTFSIPEVYGRKGGNQRDDGGMLRTQEVFWELLMALDFRTSWNNADGGLLKILKLLE